MAARQKPTKEELFLRKTNFFRRNAFLIIDKMVELNNPFLEHKSLLVDEVLHSIFFLGGINFPEFLPGHIFSNNTEDGRVMLEALMRRYPGPFKCYTSQLPKRSPVSCVLDMIVLLTEEENEHEIIEMLKEFMNKLKEGPTKELVSSTICVSQPDDSQTSKRYYGVSMSTSGPNPGQIVIAASCLSNWDSYVSGAVMTDILQKDFKKNLKKYLKQNRLEEDFDGTIILPKSVRCQAFSLSDANPMAPCRSCGNLFGLETNEIEAWDYGNCAEVESVSNLLKNEQGVKRQVQTRCTDAERERAIKIVQNVLEGLVNMVKFGWEEKKFYTPHAAVL